MPLLMQTLLGLAAVVTVGMAHECNLIFIKNLIPGLKELRNKDTDDTSTAKLHQEIDVVCNDGFVVLLDGSYQHTLSGSRTTLNKATTSCDEEHHVLNEESGRLKHNVTCVDVTKPSRDERCFSTPHKSYKVTTARSLGINDSYSWDAAHAICKGLGGKMALPYPPDHKLINRWLSAYPPAAISESWKGFFIDLSDRDKEGVWVDSDGTVRYRLALGGFVDWSPMSPNNAGEQQHCAVATKLSDSAESHWKWNDYYCSTLEQLLVCETRNPACPDDLKEFYGACSVEPFARSPAEHVHYIAMFFADGIDFEMSREKCKAAKGKVVLPQSAEEAAWIGAFLAQYPPAIKIETPWTGYYLDLTDQDAEGVWKDSSGREVFYWSYWEPTFGPNNHNNMQHCAASVYTNTYSIYHRWVWNDMACDSNDENGVQPLIMCEVPHCETACDAQFQSLAYGNIRTVVTGLQTDDQVEIIDMCHQDDHIWVDGRVSPSQNRDTLKCDRRSGAVDKELECNTWHCTLAHYANDAPNATVLANSGRRVAFLNETVHITCPYNQVAVIGDKILDTNVGTTVCSANEELKDKKLGCKHDVCRIPDPVHLLLPGAFEGPGGKKVAMDGEDITLNCYEGWQGVKNGELAQSQSVTTTCIAGGLMADHLTCYEKCKPYTSTVTQFTYCFLDQVSDYEAMKHACIERGMGMVSLAGLDKETAKQEMDVLHTQRADLHGHDIAFTQDIQTEYYRHSEGNGFQDAHGIPLDHDWITINNPRHFFCAILNASAPTGISDSSCGELHRVTCQKRAGCQNLPRISNARWLVNGAEVSYAMHGQTVTLLCPRNTKPIKDGVEQDGDRVDTTCEDDNDGDDGKLTNIVDCDRVAGGGPSVPSDIDGTDEAKSVVALPSSWSAHEIGLLVSILVLLLFLFGLMIFFLYQSWGKKWLCGLGKTMSVDGKSTASTSSTRNFDENRDTLQLNNFDYNAM